MTNHQTTASTLQKTEKSILNQQTTVHLNVQNVTINQI
jgi:hypothetical protein